MTTPNIFEELAQTKLFNVCDEIRCPYNTKQGCQRYSVSPHCHLAYPKPGEKRPGIFTMASQYWLYADDSVDMAQVRKDQDTWLATPEEIERAGLIQRLKEQP